jgi:transcriptional regulator with XRE-family HTH domain
MNLEMPFSIPDFASGAELLRVRKAHGVSLEDLARCMATSRAYVSAIEERRSLRQCTIRRYLLTLWCFVEVRTMAAAQKSKNSSNAEKNNGIVAHGS